MHVTDPRGAEYVVELWKTKSYVGGTPNVWEFRVPDMGRSAALPRLTASHWVAAAAAGGRAMLMFGDTPPDGSELRWTIHYPPSHFGHWLPFRG